MKQYKVEICDHTKKEVIKVKDGENWLCLHNESDFIDQVAVDAFRAGQNFKKKS